MTEHPPCPAGAEPPRGESARTGPAPDGPARGDLPGHASAHGISSQAGLPAPESVVVPVVHETLEVHRTVADRGGVRVRKQVREYRADIDEPRFVDDVTVERVLVDRFVDAPPPTRQEGDTLVVPVVEEVIVTQRRWKLREEVRITRQRREAGRVHAPVTLRTEEAVVERQAAPGEPWHPEIVAPQGQPGQQRQAGRQGQPGQQEQPGQQWPHASPARTEAAPATHGHQAFTDGSPAMQTVIGVFDDPFHARKAARALGELGCRPQQVHLHAVGAGGEHASLEAGDAEVQQHGAQDPVLARPGPLSEVAGAAQATQPAPSRGHVEPFVDVGTAADREQGAMARLGRRLLALFGAHDDTEGPTLEDRQRYAEQAGHYAEAVRRGATLIEVDCDDEAQAAAVAAALEHSGAVDIDRRVEQWQQAGYTGFDASAPAFTAEQAQAERARWAPDVPVTAAVMPTMDVGAVSPRESMSAPEPGWQADRDRALQGGAPVAASSGELGAAGATLDVIQQELRVGKRVVQRGGVRVLRRVREMPVEQVVQLREEHAVVHREPADRIASAEELRALRDETIEVRETAEEPVVEKVARVVEEVHVDRAVSQRTETIHDTVLRSDVEVQPLGQAPLGSGSALSGGPELARPLTGALPASGPGAKVQGDKLASVQAGLHGTAGASDARSGEGAWADARAAQAAWQAGDPDRRVSGTNWIGLSPPPQRRRTDPGFSPGVPLP